MPTVTSEWSVRALTWLAGGVGLLVLAAAITAACYHASPLVALGLPVVLAYLVLACTRPVTALCLGLLLPVAEMVQVPLAGLGSLSPTEGAFLVMAAGWAWRALTGVPGVRYPEIADYPLIVLVLSVLPALAWGAPAQDVLRLLLMWTAFFLVYLTVKGFSPSELRRTAAVLGLGAGVLAVMGLLTYVQGGGAQVSASGTDVSGRAAFGIPDPNYYAAYLQLAAAPLLGLVIARGGRLRLPAAAVLGLVGLAVVASLSRGAILGTVLTVAVVVSAFPRARAVAAGLFVVVVATSAVNLNPFLESRATEVVTERLTSVGVSSENNKRGLLLERGVELVLERPQGVGALQFRTVSGSLGLTERGRPLENLHNAYVNLAVELGLVGLAAYLLWMLRVARDLVSELGRRRAETFPLVVGLSGAFAGFSFQALTIVQYRVQTILATAFVLAGMAAAARAWPGEPEGRSSADAPVGARSGA